MILLVASKIITKKRKQMHERGNCALENQGILSEKISISNLKVIQDVYETPFYQSEDILQLNYALNIPKSASKMCEIF